MGESASHTQRVSECSAAALCCQPADQAVALTERERETALPLRCKPAHSGRVPGGARAVKKTLVYY